jgi:LytS/YehU family sensor histidine kinase
MYPNPFFKRNKFWLFGTLILITIISGILIRLILFGIVYSLHYDKDPSLQYAFTNVAKPIASIVYGGFVFCVASMIYFNNQWQKQLQLTNQLEGARKQAELELLQSQVKPHFIFNTLNNIYTLSLKQSAQTPQMIYKLSYLLRYMLYDSKRERIALGKELNYIENYLALEKLRYNGTLDVLINQFTDTKDVTIPPLILLPLVENSIKHGASQQIGLSWIRMDISTERDWLTVTIENNKSRTKKDADTYAGIGIKNVTQRLNLIYKEKQSIDIIDDEDSFMVKLRLQYKNNE